MANTEFERFLEEKLKEDRGLLVPIKASLFELMFVKKADADQLHPNPEDEFCNPDIGPNHEIVSQYRKMITRPRPLEEPPWEEPLTVEKVHPDGYMILNGHHRWAAAMQTAYSPIKIAIVNLTHEKDIERMVSQSTHDRRVTLDLDELAFCTGEDVPAEKPLPFPLNMMYKERIRQGVPALLRFFGKQGYDVWVYTSKYRSIEYIRAYFRHYFVKVDGIVTGYGRSASMTGEELWKAKDLIAGRYKETLHIDLNAILRTHSGSRDFEEYPVETQGAGWSGAVMDIVRGLK